jgi:hypothetical protein
MTNWIEWNGGDCPIKSDKTLVEYKMKNASLDIFHGTRLRWNWEHNGNHGDIIAYRIIDDHEPKMTREQITAQIEALHENFRTQSRLLQEQLDCIHSTKRYYWLNDGLIYSSLKDATNHIDIEIRNGVPVAATIKEVLK